MTTTQPVPWRAPMSVGDVPEGGLRVELEADEPTCRAVAKAAGVNEIARLRARFDLSRRGRDGLRVVGTVCALVGQLCVVSLEPVVNEVEEAIDVVFGLGTSFPTSARSLDIPVDAPDPPEPLVDGMLDLGAIATEFLILGIDPYPRKPGAAFVAPPDKETAGKAFAALAALKRSSPTD
ncbi:MAG TPA: DUF177 domain-containing protein [Xanthobacteraceae bacterium]|nr:DUF177 domain-containing protein [Xanthobacteraceae bacterium]